MLPCLAIFDSNYILDEDGGLQQIYLQHTTGILREEEYQSVIEMLQNHHLRPRSNGWKVGCRVVYLNSCKIFWDCLDILDTCACVTRMSWECRDILDTWQVVPVFQGCPGSVWTSRTSWTSWTFWTHDSSACATSLNVMEVSGHGGIPICLGSSGYETRMSWVCRDIQDVLTHP